MNIKMSSGMYDSIANSEHGKELIECLKGFDVKGSNFYTRGMLHGFFLALTSQGVISKADAIQTLLQLER